jgi:hypothetical protein
LTVNIGPARKKPPIVPAKRPRKTWSVWLIAVGSLGLVVIFCVVLSFRSAPTFYTNALTIETSASKTAGDEFERRTLDLTNKTKRVGKWSATFSNDQINGWLATDLIEKFPGSLPPSIADPRVDLQAEEISLALHWSWWGLGGVAVLRADIFCTDRPSEIAIRFKGARTGVLSLPIKSIGDAIAGSLASSGFSTRWTEIDGDPVLIALPPASFRQRDRARIAIKSIDVKESEVMITGETTIE